MILGDDCFFFYKHPIEDDLEHSGRLGMKWGVRNGPPYPLGEDQMSAAEKRLALGKRYVGANVYVMRNGDRVSTALTNISDVNKYEVTKRHFKSKLVSALSKLLPVYDSVAENIINNKNAYPITDNESREAHAKFRISELDMKMCNPDFGEPGTINNCAKATAALELRLRGYDVSAGRQTYPSEADWMTVWFKNAKPEVKVEKKDVDTHITSYGKNTSGTISVEYPDGGGHSMHWTVDGDGKLEIQCGQSGNRWSSFGDLSREIGDDVNKIYISRLDDCEIDLEAMSRDSVVRRYDDDSAVEYVEDSNSRHYEKAWR